MKSSLLSALVLSSAPYCGLSGRTRRLALTRWEKPLSPTT